MDDELSQKGAVLQLHDTVAQWAYICPLCDASVERELDC